MKKLVGQLLLAAFVFLLPFPGGWAEEMYILTTRDGSEIIVRDYTFTDEHVEFTTGNGLPGFIKKENLVKISNMVGVPSKPETGQQTVQEIKQRELLIWIVSAAVLVILYCVFLLYVIRTKRGRKGEEGGILPGSVEKKPKTQGHLSFRYKERTGRQTDWVIEVGTVYEKDGILFIEGICTATDKKKTFRSDRVIGPVTDMSSGRRCRIEAVFTDAA